jgi:hypothetical protein
VEGLAGRCPRGPRLSAPCGSSGSASPHDRLGGPGGPVLFSAVPPSGALSHSALAPYPGFPPSSVADGPPASVTGGAGPAVLLPALLRWALGGGVILAALCVLSVMLSVSSVVVLWGRSPALPTPTLTAAAFPLARAQGWVYPCVLRHVFCARLSPCGWTCVPGCGHVCVCQSSLFCCPPAVFVPPRARTVEDLPLLHGSARLLACFCRREAHGGVCSAVPFRRVSFDELVPSHCRIPCLSGAAYCRPVGFLAGTPQVLRWASSPPQCVSHPLLSDLYCLARCLSPGAPPRR